MIEEARKVGGDDGFSSVATLVILTPLLVVMFLGVVQYGLRSHAQQLVEAAAQDAARVLEHEGGTEAEASTVATNFLASSVQSGFLTGPPQITFTGDDQTVRVVVTAQVTSPGLLPMSTTVQGVSAGPIETFQEP